MPRLIRRSLTLILCLCVPALSVSAKNFPKVSPENVGLSPDRLERVSELFREYIAQHQLSGAVALVARKGRIAYFEHFGEMDLDEAIPMRRDAIFRIASMTKPITSTAVLILHEEGRFLLADPVSRHIAELGMGPEVYSGMNGQSPRYEPLERPITLHHLMTHTSGLTYGIFGNTPVDRAYVEARVLVPDLDGMVRKLAGLPLLFQPGERWNYSVSTDVLGKLIENVSGMTLDEFFEIRIFRPLGMRDTGFFVPESKVGRIATVYRPKDDQPGLEVSINSRKNPFISRRPKMLSGGGGLFSTAADYLRFCQMLLNGGELFGKRVLSPKTVALMTRNHVGDFNPLDRKGFGFGLGVAVHLNPAESGSLESIGTYYWGGIFNTTFFVDPEEQLIGIAMSQLSPNGHLDTARRFRLLVYQALTE